MRQTRRDTGTPLRDDVVRAPHGTGEDPPDVIEVVFPAGPAAAGPASHRARRPAEALPWPERPVLYGGLTIIAVGLAALLAWVVWPQAAPGTDAYRPLPAPSYAPLPLPHTVTPVQKRPSTTAGTPRRTPVAPSAPQPTATSGTGASPTSAAGGPPGTAPARPTTPGVPSPTGARTLRPGDSGPDVTQLQQLLFQQGLTYVAETGVYDAATERGVAQVQQDRGLTCDPRGVYGPCTRASLTS